MKTRPASAIFTVLIFAVFSRQMILGCNVPVFRYALERWIPSDYVLEIYHDSPFSEPENQLIRKLTAASVSGGGLLNIEVRINNTESPGFDPDLHSSLPGMVLYFPDDETHNNPIWAASLTGENVEKLIDSPARKKLRQELLNENTAVFLILSSSGGDRDREREEFTQEVLKQAEKDIYITAPGTDVHGNPIKNPDFSHTELKFSSVFIDRMDPEEELLARILLGTERDLWDYDVPMAFPVFGRGRILYALVGNGINKSTLYTACSAVTGWCSCIVKDDNPGTDLLIAADWDTGIDESWIEPEELPELEGISTFADAGIESDTMVPEIFSKDTVADPPAVPQIQPETVLPEKSADSTGRLFIILMITLFISVVILSWIIFRRRDI